MSLTTLAVIALALGPTKDIGFGAQCEASVVQAEADFEARRAELGLVGSAPMVGLEQIVSISSEDFEARRTELGLLGSAPMVGLERPTRRALVERTPSDAASGASVAKISSVRSRNH